MPSHTPTQVHTIHPPTLPMAGLILILVPKLHTPFKTILFVIPQEVAYQLLQPATRGTVNPLIVRIPTQPPFALGQAPSPHTKHPYTLKLPSTITTIWILQIALITQRLNPTGVNIINGIILNRTLILQITISMAHLLIHNSPPKHHTIKPTVHKTMRPPLPPPPHHIWLLIHFPGIYIRVHL